MTSTTLSIGQVAERSDTPATTLRYYEKRGLIDPPQRVSGQRRYNPSITMRLMVIRFCRSAGLSLDEIHTVLNDGTRNRTVTKEIAARRIESIDEQIGELTVARLLMTSTIACSCASVEECHCGAMDNAVVALIERVTAAMP